jgi:TetR/AcrR family transcriptional repressor of nem operon
MGRPRRFDETEALEAAMRCFWDRGFEATSVRDLADEMGLTGASLYNAFGDKRALFRRALDHYVAQIDERIAAAEASAPSVAGIRAFFVEVVQRASADPRCRGCLLVNTTLELDADDDELRRAVGAAIGSIEAFFLRCIRAGQADGSVAAAQPAAALARMLLSVLLGMRVLSRTDPGKAALEAVVETAMATLEPARQGAR